MIGKLGALALLVVLPLASSAASSHGVLVDVVMVTTVHTQGSRAGPPQRAGSKLCLTSLVGYPRAMATMLSREGCTMTRFSQHAGVVTFLEHCARHVPTVIAGIFHISGASSFTGTMRETFGVAGNSMEVDERFSGRRIGVCSHSGSEQQRTV